MIPSPPFFNGRIHFPFLTPLKNIHSCICLYAPSITVRRILQDFSQLTFCLFLVSTCRNYDKWKPWRILPLTPVVDGPPCLVMRSLRTRPTSKRRWYCCRGSTNGCSRKNAECRYIYRERQ